MKKIEKLLLIVTIIIILLIVSILLIILNNKNNSNNDTKFNELNEQQDISEYNEISSDTNLPTNNDSLKEYFEVKNCIKMYLDALDKDNYVFYDTYIQGEKRDYNEENQKEAIYNLLSKSYIDDKRITKENLNNFVKMYDESQKFYPIEIKLISDSNVLVYKVKGIVQDFNSSKSQFLYSIVNVSENDKKFSIEPLDEETYNNYKIKNIADVGKVSFNIPNIDDEYIATECLDIYRDLTFANPSFTYEMMTDEYKNKRFGNLEEFKKYIIENKEEVKSIQTKQFMKIEENGETQYVVKDQYENLYIFDVSNILDMKIKLDTYTLKEKKFDNEYVKASANKKVQMNIDKFFQMINRHDYKTSYNCLDESFINNNMISQERFENMFKQNLWNYNKVEYLNFKEIGGNTYMYELSLTDLINDNNVQKKMTVIMKLLEDTDFKMSFSME